MQQAMLVAKTLVLLVQRMVRSFPTASRFVALSLFFFVGQFDIAEQTLPWV